MVTATGHLLWLELKMIFIINQSADYYLLFEKSLCIKKKTKFPTVQGDVINSQNPEDILFPLI